MSRYRRIMVKLSGAAMAGTGSQIFDRIAIEHIVDQVVGAIDLGVAVAIMVGGGNIFRGNVASAWNIERAEADNMGMLATVINGVMMRAAINAKTPTDVRVMSSIAINQMAEPYIRLRANRHLDKGSIVVLVGGIGQPYVTTDYPSVQRALELRCDAILAAKHGVDGVFTADPKRDPAAKRFSTISFDDVIRQDLRVMDQSAMLLARDHRLPVHLFNFDKPGAIRRICLGEDVGTTVTHDAALQLVEDAA
ncbi:MAG: UMP kinase [Alphaproteobacteria bacterium]|nr:UMP kinase [Alphaproteobacteria bacterium]TAD88672.1 MAG: UMP kinase [Alphaproteobacteria bacterium]